MRNRQVCDMGVEASEEEESERGPHGVLRCLWVEDRVEVVLSLLSLPHVGQCQHVWHVERIYSTPLRLKAQHRSGPRIHPDLALHVLQLIVELLPQNVLVLQGKRHEYALFFPYRKEVPKAQSSAHSSSKKESSWRISPHHQFLFR